MNKFSVQVLVVFCCLIFSNCDTTVKIIGDSTKSELVELQKQPLAIVWENTELTKDFIISFKNHLKNELLKKGIAAEFSENKNNNPNVYVLEIKVISERSRELYHATGVVKAFREAVIDVALKNTEGAILKKNQVHVNHVYQSELTTAARKAASKWVEQLKLSN